jgi:hypothetical protein
VGELGCRSLSTSGSDVQTGPWSGHESGSSVRGKTGDMDGAAVSDASAARADAEGWEVGWSKRGACLMGVFERGN